MPQLNKAENGRSPTITAQENSQPSIAIAVAAHAPYWMPSDTMYLPVQAGAALHDPIEGFCRDDQGEGNISLLNPHLSELTAMYWAWKNLDAGAKGLGHYRRHFQGSGEHDVLTPEEARDLLRKAPVIVPRERNYVIETVGDHYAHTFDASHLELLKQVVSELSPDSLPALEKRLASTRAHMFNMTLMHGDFFDAYAGWMFPIVLEVERRFDYDGSTPFTARAPGRLAEFLIDTWIDTNDVPFVERKVKDMEPVNWVNKGASFLAAKFLGKKYDKSF